MSLLPLLLGLLGLLLPHCSSVALAALQPPEEYRPSQLVQATLHVLEHSVSPRYNALAIMELSHSDAVQLHHRKAMTYLLQQLGERMALQLLQDTPIEQPREYILFLVDSPLAFRELRFHFAKTLFDREFYFLIVLTLPPATTERSLLEGLNDIFATCLSFHVLNAVVLVHSAIDDVVLMYGFRLYAPDCSVSFTPLLLNRYERGQLLEQSPLFDRALSSFYGCPLRVSWYPLPPFVMFDGDRDDPQQRLESWRLTGVDGELLKVLSHIFDFRLQLLAPCEKKISNLSSDDCFQQLDASNSSIAIGALSASHWHRDRFSTTSSYHQSALVFVVRMDPYMGAVNQLVQPFCVHVWLALILSCLSALLLQWSWHWGRSICSVPFDLSASALHVHTTLLGNPLQLAALPRSNAVRCFLGAWLLLALVQRVAYQGKLYDVFRLPYIPPVPEHISDLVEGDYLYLASNYADYFPAHRTLVREANYQQRFEELEAAEDGARLTTSALLGNLAHHNHLNWKTSRLTHVQEHIYLYQLVMYLRRHSILKFAFDRKLKQLQSSGIVGHINRHFERRMFHAPYAKTSHEVTPVRLEMFCGLYFIACLMMLAAILVFVLEVISKRVAWLRRYFV